MAAPVPSVPKDSKRLGEKGGVGAFHFKFFFFFFKGFFPFCFFCFNVFVFGFIFSVLLILVDVLLKFVWWLFSVFSRQILDVFNLWF